ncbi:hypothetical protein QW131_27560 [Roseibium salinum]|nr:hypothetical protein [Roseibium salinum]
MASDVKVSLPSANETGSVAERPFAETATVFDVPKSSPIVSGMAAILEKEYVPGQPATRSSWQGKRAGNGMDVRNTPDHAERQG